MSGEIKYIGESADGRTNRWRIECPSCGKSFIPPVTRLAQHEFFCPGRKCLALLLADYNAEPPTVALLRKG